MRAVLGAPQKPRHQPTTNSLVAASALYTEVVQAYNVGLIRMRRSVHALCDMCRRNGRRTEADESPAPLTRDREWPCNHGRRQVYKCTDEKLWCLFLAFAV